MTASGWRGAAALAALAIGLLSAGTAVAAPVPAALQQSLLELYGRWQQLIGKGKLAEAAAISVPDLRQQIIAAAKSKADAEGLARMAKEMAPDKVDPEHAALSKDGSKITILTVATKTIPMDAKLPPGGPKPGTVMNLELTLKFEREGANWRFAEQLFGIDLGAIKSCHDASSETVADYDRARTQNAGGLVRRVEFKADHTLVVFRVLEEEECAILPPAAVLKKGGFDLALLMPYAVVEFTGYPHKSDSQRIWVDQFRVIPEE